MLMSEIYMSESIDNDKIPKTENDIGGNIRESYTCNVGRRCNEYS
jgi:hypothetical protein